MQSVYRVRKTKKSMSSSSTQVAVRGPARWAMQGRRRGWQSPKGYFRSRINKQRAHYAIFIRSLLDSYSIKTGEAIARPRLFRKRKDTHYGPLPSVLSKPQDVE